MMHSPSWVRSMTTLATFAACLLIVSASRAEISPNSAGSLILHATTPVEMTDAGALCGDALLEDCADAVIRSDRSAPIDLHVLVAFPEGASPRLTGVTFAVEYEDDVVIREFQCCGDFQLADTDWPWSGTGTTVAWSAPQETQFIEVYTFRVVPAAGAESEFRITPHPLRPTAFTDDAVPPRRIPPQGLGSFGFGVDGSLPCPLPDGACRNVDGSCEITLESECVGEGDVWEGPFVPCVAVDGIGACCDFDWNCTIQTYFDCTRRSYEFQGDDTLCSPNPCPPPVGACCGYDWTCEIKTRTDCMWWGQYYDGDDTVCTPEFCVRPPMGACCFDTGSCVVLTSDRCAVRSGIYLGTDVPCDPNPCPSGPCCFRDGRCVMRTEESCISLGGDYHPDQDDCDPDPCAGSPGACCFEGDVCTIVSMADCVESDGLFLGPWISCDPGSCSGGPGACCVASGDCRFESAADCAKLGGIYILPGEPCKPDPCTYQADCGSTESLEGWTDKVRQVRQAQRGREGDAPEMRLPDQVNGSSPPFPRGNCGTVYFNADFTFETAYAWGYGGVQAPAYGTFAESYDAIGVLVCGIILELTQPGGVAGRTIDLYVWEDDQGEPGTVLGIATGVDPGPVATWPSVSTHELSISSNCTDSGRFHVGYWGDWPGESAAYYIAADLDGFGGCPMTLIPPGIDYPSGWDRVSLIWGSTRALGIGAEVGECGTVDPVHEKSWGQIKALFR